MEDISAPSRHCLNKVHSSRARPFSFKQKKRKHIKPVQITVTKAILRCAPLGLLVEKSARGHSPALQTSLASKQCSQLCLPWGSTGTSGTLPCHLKSQGAGSGLRLMCDGREQQQFCWQESHFLVAMALSRPSVLLWKIHFVAYHDASREGLRLERTNLYPKDPCQS